MIRRISILATYKEVRLMFQPPRFPLRRRFSAVTSCISHHLLTCDGPHSLERRDRPHPRSLPHRRLLEPSDASAPQNRLVPSHGHRCLLMHLRVSQSGSDPSRQPSHGSDGGSYAACALGMVRYLLLPQIAAHLHAVLT